MNIKKIILEEIDDLGWMDDISDNPFTLSPHHVIWLDVPLDEKQAELVLMTIKSGGYKALDLHKRTIENIVRTSNKYEGYLRLQTMGPRNYKKFSYGYGIELFREISNNGNIEISDIEDHKVSEILNITNESMEYHLDRLVESCSILTEDNGPDMEWDFEEVKDTIDKSQEHIKDKQDADNYLKTLLDKIKNLPNKVKSRIIKYSAISLLTFLSVSEIKSVISQQKTPSGITNTTNKSVSKLGQRPQEKIIIREPSDNLTDFLKYEEGSVKHKGDPVLSAYDIGDGSITIGWGHAENKNRTKMVAGTTTVTKKQASKLLQRDIDENSRYLNNILNKWEKDGVDVNVTQGMYDAMTSMMFNMGVGNFRKSEFIQLVKRGEMEKAKEKIKTTNVTYKGHIYRRQKESEMFAK